MKVNFFLCFCATCLCAAAFGSVTPYCNRTTSNLMAMALQIHIHLPSPWSPIWVTDIPVCKESPGLFIHLALLWAKIPSGSPTSLDPCLHGWILPLQFKDLLRFLELWVENWTHIEYTNVNLGGTKKDSYMGNQLWGTYPTTYLCMFIF